MLVLTAFVGLSTNVSAEDLIADAGGPYEAYECEEITLDASGSSGGSGPLMYQWDFGYGWTGWSSGQYYPMIWLDNGVHSISLQVTDGITIAEDTTTVTLLNKPPEILSIEGPVDEVTVGEEIDLLVLFFDGLPDPRGFILSMDSYTGTIYWDDGNSESFLFEPEDVIDTGDQMYFILEASHTYLDTGIYEIIVLITDDDGGQVTGYWTVLVDGGLPALVVDAGPDGLIDEGSLLLSAGSLSDTMGLYSALVDYGDGSGPQGLLLNPDNTFALQHQYCENGTYVVLVTVFYGGVLCGSDDAIITVNNVPPTITSLYSSSLDPVQLGTPILLTGEFFDPGSEDTHTATIEWGDGGITMISVLDGTYLVTGSHTYADAGVYQITLTVADDDGGSDSEILQHYIVVFDPDGGFVTGGGWIIAPPGSYPTDPTLTGKATFGFVSKYKKGQSTPSGNTEFQFHAANMNFHSHLYLWLVITNCKAMYKGVGTINGEGLYGFMLTAIDGQINGGGGVDKLRMKIWDTDGNIIFDNNLGLPNDDDPVTALSSGQITIHKK
ncbi:MAG: hypothetical protein JW840_05425 [Candidatus Thermoplasmatota archaeon]|nr:hypothetical protein [Candidatus Thermoplasmatota archaeon]